MAQLLKDKVVIITGSASGIGLATAKLALAEGAKVFGIDISPFPESLQNRPNFAFIKCDLADESAPKEIVTRCLETYGGRIDVLANVAGVMDHYSSVENVTDEMWERCLTINLTAPVKLMRAVVPIMKEQRAGSIINVGSRASLGGAVSGIAYTSSKHALVGATKSVAWISRTDNIRCNMICPGAVGTGIMSSIDTSKFDTVSFETLKPIIDQFLVKKPDYEVMQPEDQAHAIVFLASDKGARINGAIIPIDDAWSAI